MPRVFRLTQKTVESLACPAGKKDVLVFDGELRGFGVRVGSNGKKSFVAQYTGPTGKRRMALGAFGVLTVDAARKSALAVLGAVAERRDPVAEERAKAAAQRAAEAAAKGKAAADAFTFGKLAEAWRAAREGDRRHSYLYEAASCLKRNLPDWQDRPAAAMTIPDAVLALDQIKREKGVVAANRTQAYARAAYSWAVKRQMLAINPFRGIDRPGREAPRERVLTTEECGAIWRACEALPSVRGAFVRVLLLTLTRRDEVASMQWAELDNPADPTLWTLPGARTKNGKPHIVHLSEPVRAALRALPKVAGNPSVFIGGSRAGAIGHFSGMKAGIVEALAAAGDDMPDWRFHDFRRAGVTALADMGIAPHVADRLLNHITGSIQGVAAIYQRAEFLAERKAALDAWAAHVLAAAEGKAKPDNVVALRRGRADGGENVAA